MLVLGLRLSVGWLSAASLPIEAYIFSAEMHGINIALILYPSKQKVVVSIFVTPSSVVKSLHVHCYHPIIRRLIHRTHDLPITGKTISICWIPSHMGIKGNDSADAAAKGASERLEEQIPIYHSDWRSIIRNAQVGKWKQRWETCRNKLREIKPDPKIG